MLADPHLPAWQRNQNVTPPPFSQSPLVAQGAREFEAAKRARLEAGRRQSGAAGSVPRRHPGVAFGTGVLEEDDAEGIMDDYVVHGDVGGEVESVNADARGLPARRGPGVQRVGLGDRLLAGGYSFEIQVLCLKGLWGLEGGGRCGYWARWGPSHGCLPALGEETPGLLEAAAGHAVD